MKIYACNEQKSDEFPLTWDDALSLGGLFKSKDGVRYVILDGLEPAAFCVIDDTVQTVVASIRDRYRYRRLDNAKLCLEIRE